MKQIVIKRWSYIGLYSVLSAYIVFIISELLGDKIALVYKVLPINSSWYSLVAIFIVALIVRKILLHTSVCHYQRPIKSVIAYPPLSFAIFGGLVVLVCFKFSVNSYGMNFLEYLDGLFNHMNTIELWCFIGLQAAFIVYEGSKDCVLVKEKQEIIRLEVEKGKESECEVENKDTKEDKLITWLKTEKPVEEDKQLLFDHSVFVERILIYLGAKLKENKDTGSELVKTVGGHIALCGPFGIGKSSIVTQVIKVLTNPIHTKYELENPWVCVTCSTWGRDSDNVSGDILKSILVEMAKFVDVSAVAKLPEQYVAAMKDSNKVGKAFSHFLISHNDPKACLEKLDEILAAIGYQLLIVIEDIDRNNQPQKAANELAALLDQLKTLKQVNFIVAFGYDEDTSAIVSRVCEYREDIPLINNPSVIVKLVNIWIDRAEKSGCILPGYSPVDINANNLQLAEEVEVAALLLDTPRVFKQALRRVDVIWQKSRLLGEIDLKQLILFNAVRTVAPEKVAYLYFHVGKRSDKNKELFPSGKSSRENNDESNDNNEEKFDDVVSKALSKLGSKSSVWEPLQFICSDALFVNYYDRMLKEQIGQNEEPDQDFIKQLDAWNSPNFNLEIGKKTLEKVCGTSTYESHQFRRFFGIAFGKVPEENKEAKLAAYFDIFASFKCNNDVDLTSPLSALFEACNSELSWELFEKCWNCNSIKLEEFKVPFTANEDDLQKFVSFINSEIESGAMFDRLDERDDLKSLTSVVETDNDGVEGKVNLYRRLIASFLRFVEGPVEDNSVVYVKQCKAIISMCAIFESFAATQSLEGTWYNDLEEKIYQLMEKPQYFDQKLKENTAWDVWKNGRPLKFRPVERGLRK